MKSYNFDSKRLNQWGEVRRETYLEHIDELRVANVAILVGVEVVEHDTEFLSGEENSKFWHKLFEFQFAQNTVLISVKALWK